MVGQLKLFKLVDEAHQYAQKYYVAPLENRESYMDYDGVSSENRFDRTRFKTLAFEQLKKESIRRKAYEQIHGKVQNESN